ncbi:MAG: hypothetical protein EXS05_08500 [Planctomycetaceae bacterium]|nr:hypothetical protein [Planctomycetaceae bacterium]
MPIDTIDRWINRYASRIRLGEFLKRGAEWGAAYLFAFGATVLVVKMLIPQAWPHVLWLGVGVVVALAAAWWLTRKPSQTRWQSVARLDAAINSGGLLMTLCERPADDWADRLPQIERLWHEAIPRVRPRRFAGYITLPLLFALGACFVPLRNASTAPTLYNTVGQQAAQELEELLNEIEKEQLLGEDEEQQLKKEVEKLTEETRDTPLTHEKWETVDALRERMKVRLETAAMSLAKARGAAALLADSNLSDTPQMSLERSEQLENDLAESLQKMMQKGGLAGVPKDLKEQLQRLMKNGKLQMPKDAGDRQELLDELKEYLDKENDKLNELRKKCSGCKSGQCDKEGECEGGQCEGNKSGSRPGKGGITRGRGDADLTFGDESDRQGAKFKEVVLPKGFRDQPKDEVLGVQKRAPDEEAAEVAPRAARQDVDPAAGQATWNRKLSPRHRNSVRRYFDSRETN